MRISRRVAVAILLATLLFWLNAYIARDLFVSGHTGKTNSMHGYWTAIARLATVRHWFWPSWWPYWDVGMPFEWTYAPLVPGLTALRARVTGVDPAVAFGWVSGLFYCLTPVALFASAAVLSGRLPASFSAGLVYSLSAPTQLLMPDQTWKLSGFGDARRLYLVAAWDDTPHIAAITFLPLVVLFTALALRSGTRARWWLLASASMGLSVAANAFGATAVFLTLCCVLLAWASPYPLLNTLRVAAAGALGWCLIAGWFPLSELSSMKAGADLHGHGWSLQSCTALAVVVCAITVAWALCSRFHLEAWARFVTLFAVLMTAIPITYALTGREFLPQSGRYKLEAELSLALALAFGAAALLRRLPVPLKIAFCALGLAIAAEQTQSYRRFEKQIVRSSDMSKTIEGRVAAYFRKTMPEARVAVPGSLAQWLNNFGPQQQFAGSSWATAYNPAQQHWNTAWQTAQTQEQARITLDVLRNYGVEAYVIAGKSSPEFWKAISKPEVYDGCDLLWSEEDTHVCRLDQGAGSLPRPLRWLDANEAAISAVSSSGEPILVPVTWHPGWHAISRGSELRIVRDRLGLIRVEPDKPGQYDIRLVYRGGFELIATRTLMYGTWVVVALFIARRIRRKSVRAAFRRYMPT